jgi:hypothetical protein
MQTEIETIKVIHISNQGFDWRIVVKDDPEFPEQAILIEHHEEGELKESVSFPKDAIRSLQTVLESFIG